MTEHTSEAKLWARLSRSFGKEAAAYAQHRPGYPVAALRWGLPSNAEHVLDLGAGTGKLTEGLLDLDLRVTAVEPDPAMLAELARRHPGVRALDGTAEGIPLGDAEVDSVLVGQAFHWFDMDRALTEIARVLKPGGTVVALWNHRDDSVPWVAELDTLARTSVARSWDPPEPFPPVHAEFGLFELETFPNGHRRTAETLLETFATHSKLLVAAEDEREATLARLRDFLANNPKTAEGEFTYPLTTRTLRATRR
ncbi:class I SAM-dependent methyltransferase [Amycolatopsis taiwanensis]|uniref:Type 11 methyltransferase n=1 Tax=Amycolatopsis taiwanensis TaxID=342230 RepID=A0A9W6R6W9_9PSEU|nr:methyltransferase domain-containing protein [Amycolatopsis taiwanensis]GLY68560.1 type 11 methyltransferase [Amycolatopsis taiwanensis]